MCFFYIGGFYWAYIHEDLDYLPRITKLILSIFWPVGAFSGLIKDIVEFFCDSGDKNETTNNRR